MDQVQAKMGLQALETSIHVCVCKMDIICPTYDFGGSRKQIKNKQNQNNNNNDIEPLKQYFIFNAKKK